MAGSIAELLSGVFGSGQQEQQPADDNSLTKKIEKVRALMGDVSGGNSAQFLTQVDMARGATPGTADPRVLESLTTPEDLAIADRVAWGKRLAETEPIPTAGLSLLPTIGYEGMKAMAGTKAGGALMKTVGDAFAKVGGARGKQLGDWFVVDETSSPASLGNIGALLSGYWGQ